ncbi:hypothetical protein ABTY20_04390 [Streptomyces sp. NPDC126497]|uniref:hypothetical protein n=1 Tax=Streptomyces sp. NPDC126497 TaxID=3155313 RepID=UPI00331D1914
MTERLDAGQPGLGDGRTTAAQRAAGTAGQVRGFDAVAGMRLEPREVAVGKAARAAAAAAATAPPRKARRCMSSSFPVENAPGRPVRDHHEAPMTTDAQDSTEGAPPRAVLYVYAERSPLNPNLGAQRAEQEGRIFTAARNIRTTEAVTEPVRATRPAAPGGPEAGAGAGHRAVAGGHRTGPVTLSAAPRDQPAPGAGRERALLLDAAVADGSAAMTTTGMLHDEHRLLGRLVRGTASGRTGILQAIAPDVGTDAPVAWLRPSGGGIEWTTQTRAIEPVTVPTPDRPSPQKR